MKGWAEPINFMGESYPGFIYFVQMDRIGPIKIGFTKDIGKRIIHLQTSNPYPLKLLYFFPAKEEWEKEIQDGFKEMRLEGEWFLPHPFILKEINLLIEGKKRREERDKCLSLNYQI